jgi:hypothetical protein
MATSIDKELSDREISLALDCAFRSNAALTRQRALIMKIASLKPALYVEQTLNSYRYEAEKQFDVENDMLTLEKYSLEAELRFEKLSGIASLIIGREVRAAHSDPRLDGRAYLPN